MKLLYYSCIVLATFGLLLRMSLLDGFRVYQYVRKHKKQIVMLGILQGLILWYVEGSLICGKGMGNLKGYAMLGMAVFGGCLLMACAADCTCYAVYNYIWWVAGAAAIGVWCLCKQENRRETEVMSLLLFAVVQEFFFCKMYGRADCHAFVVCAIAEDALGMNMRDFLLHMLLAVLLLAIVQGKSHNIGADGNLKKTVPFLPYITGSFWGMLFVKGLFVYLCIHC